MAIVNPMSTREKNSGGPNFSATAARGPARNINRTTLNVPAMKLPKAAIPRADPALPFKAIWCPSMQVMTLDGSPGMETRIEVVEPPYMDP